MKEETGWFLEAKYKKTAWESIGTRWKKKLRLRRTRGGGPFGLGRGHRILVLLRLRRRCRAGSIRRRHGARILRSALLSADDRTAWLGRAPANNTLHGSIPLIGVVF